MKNHLTLTILFILIALSACDVSTEKANQNSNSTNNTSSIDTVVAVPALPTNEVTEPSTKWIYTANLNKMTMDSNYYASITANEELQFDFPYNGGSTATLMIRNKEKRTDIILQVSKGQFNGSIDGQNIRVKFDNDKPALFSCSESSDGDPTILFIDNAHRFLSRLKSANTVLVEAEFFNAGVKQMEFDTKSLEWSYK
jgi:hypothetical protein